MSCDPRAELALAIHRKTDNGNKIVDFLNDVLDQNIPDVRLQHQLQAARMLTRHGHFPDAEIFIQRHAGKPKRKSSRAHEKSGSQFDAALKKVILAEISPASTAQWLIDVMQGRTPAIETGIDTFKPHHRMRAVREILARAYDRDYDYSQTTLADLRVPDQTDAEVTPEYHHSATEPTEQVAEDADATSASAYTPEEEAKIQEVLEKIKKIAEEADPSEYEEEETPGRKIDYSMWEEIRKQPEPVISEEHARIGAALFHEAVEKQRLWRESNVKIPVRKDTTNYDYG